MLVHLNSSAGIVGILFVILGMMNLVEERPIIRNLGLFQFCLGLLFMFCMLAKFGRLI
mgnify:FL=1